MDKTSSEVAVLAAILLDYPVIEQAEHLQPADFGVSAHSRIFAAMRDVYVAGKPVDMITLATELDRRKEVESVGGVAYLSELIDGAIDRTDIRHHVSAIKGAAGARFVAQTAEAISLQAQQPGCDLSAIRSRLQETASLIGSFESKSNRLVDIADIFDLEILDIEWIVPGIAARGTVTLWSGDGGSAKSWLALALAEAVSAGGIFLERDCTQSPVLIVDYENPAGEIKHRLETLGAGKNPFRKILFAHGGRTPPQIGDYRLEQFAREQPVMIIDTLRAGCSGADENDSGEMSCVMAHLRKYASFGGSVIALHHTTKGERPTSRGSSAIRDAVDIELFQVIDQDTGLISLRHTKNRLGAPSSMTIQPDFSRGIFELVDGPATAEGRDDVATIQAVISAHPEGVSQTQIVKEAGIGRTRGFDILRSGIGKLWHTEAGPHRSTLYFPLTGTSGTERYPVPAVPSAAVVVPVPPLYKGVPSTASSTTKPNGGGGVVWQQ